VLRVKAAKSEGANQARGKSRLDVAFANAGVAVSHRCSR
jgi:hypothetical protein